MKFLQKYKEWINSKTISEEIKSELTSLKDEKEIEDTEDDKDIAYIFERECY